MKAIAIVLFMAVSVMGVCAEITASVYQLSRMTDDDTYQVGTWQGLQLSYKPFDGLYYFVSQDGAGVYPNGKSHDYTFTTAGFGIDKRVTKGIKLFGQLGIVKIDDSLGEKRHGDIEALTYYFNERISQQLPAGYHQGFDSFGVKHDDYVVSVTLGAELTHQITDSLSVGLSLSYRGMKFHESLSAYRDDWDAHNATLAPGQTPTYWEFGLVRDYSSFNTGLSLTYQF